MPFGWKLLSGCILYFLTLKNRNFSCKSNTSVMKKVMFLKSVNIMKHNIFCKILCHCKNFDYDIWSIQHIPIIKHLCESLYHHGEIKYLKF